ncbi:MAG: aminodeoxychorismate lyase [Ignavibacteria bacterium]|nr:MAG: aminodeoxychorismate lyase [Ignavibacteria bacterium]KAF0158663.1 MAG: aminodeoxychorismate lyase [Ignavibacteria bacterium]
MPDTKKKIPLTLLTRNEFYIVTAFFAFVLILLIFTFYSPNSLPNNKAVEVELRSGDSVEQIVDSLYSKGIIPSKLNMKIAIMLKGAEKNIKAGTYYLDKPMSYIELTDVLSGSQVSMQKKVTIPEGIEQPELASIIQRELNIDSTEFIGLSGSKTFLRSLNITADNLEGYLLPETYYFYTSSGARAVIRKLNDELNTIWTKKNREQLKKLKMTEHQILTLASIIDGESNLFSEFATISGVYHNRLRIGMALQADPTVAYLIRSRKNKTITRKDLQINSKYNTYKYPGLPPGPINNPGKQAIHAALYPEKNNFFYFVANEDGTHSFAATYEQHTINVSKYRRWLRNQK